MRIKIKIFFLFFAFNQLTTSYLQKHNEFKCRKKLDFENAMPKFWSLEIVSWQEKIINIVLLYIGK